jgi:alanine-alpha-ketoisovalerate/valine-pyruvate aminotransferase
MECDRAIKEQSFVTLNTIYLFIQGAIAAANNCATIEAKQLIQTSEHCIRSFHKKRLWLTGTNRLINFNNMAT